MAEEASTRGRYVIANEIAMGGMATVFLGRMRGAVGFARTVAIKKLHPQFARDPEFVGMFVDEARLAARIQHPNVVQTLDVVVSAGEVLLVMEYIPGETLSRIISALRQQGKKIPVRIGCTIVAAMLHGLHAAHEASDESGESLNIVHRDVSPQNLVVGSDGVPRVLDFGVAKAVSRMQTTGEGQVKGKLSYMAPEQLMSLPVTRAADIFSAGVVLWEVLTGDRLLKADNEGQLVKRLLECSFMPPSLHVPGLPPVLDEIVLRSLDRNAEARYATAREMALALERAAGTSSLTEISEWLKEVAGTGLEARAALVRALEKKTITSKQTVDNVIQSVRGSDPDLIAATPTLDAAFPVPSRPHDDIDSMTGKPVTSPSIPRAELAPKPRGRLALGVVVTTLLCAAAGGAFAFRHRKATVPTAAAQPAPPPPAAPAPSPTEPMKEPAPPITAVPAPPPSAVPSATPAARVVAPVRAKQPVQPAKTTAPSDPFDLGGRR
jgi:serine/threonine-protein kinase